MRIKRFTADDMTQAMRLVRRELGPRAVILSTGRPAGGGVEISAAVEAETASPDAPRGPAPDGAPAEEAAQTSISDLARRLEGLSDRVSRHLVAAEAAAGFAARPEVAPIYHHLADQEVAPELIRRLLDGLWAPNGAGLLPRLSIRCKKMISAGYPLRPQKGRPVVWALVGPTGAGKTTTIAKLAAVFGLRQGLKVGMIAADAFRMAAAEQLQFYGRIMETPTRLAADAAEMKAAVEDMAGMDLILVDTVGRAPDDAGALREMAAALAGAPGLVSHLVLACPTRARDQERITKGFAIFKPQSLIFTKLDEPRTIGPMLNQMNRTGLPVSYLTCGQKVPDDLEEADRAGLARRILPTRRDLSRLETPGRLDQS
jgi:flagellar biosynthesis protein FlhF